MKKTVIWIVVLVVIIFIFTLQPVNNTHPENNEIKIGTLIPLSDNYAHIGESIRNGLEMAKEEILKDNSDLSIEFIHEDVCLPQESVSATQKLINVDKVDIIGAVFCTVGMIPSLGPIEQNDIIAFYTAANVDEIARSEQTFSTNFYIKDDAYRIADFAYNQLGARRGAFIIYDTQFGEEYSKYTAERFEELGGEILIKETTTLDERDFRTHLGKIKETDPDVLFTTQLTSGLGLIIKQARELGIESYMIGNYQNEDGVVLDVAGKASEGFIISSAEPSVITDRISNFRKEYQKRYEKLPDAFAANAYDSLFLQIKAYNKCGNNNDCLKESFYGVENYIGASGNITINENGTAFKESLFKVVKGGEFVEF